jgi:NADH-quinone oxidoreductase subunit G
MARPAWQILGVLLAGITDAQVPGTPADAFAALGEVAPELAGMTYAGLGPHGAVLPARRALAEAGD